RGDRRLARPRGADEGDGVTGGNRQAQVMDDLVASAGIEHGDVFEAGQTDLLGTGVGEVDVVEDDIETAGRQPPRLLGLSDVGNEVEDLEHPLERHDGAHDVQAGVGEHRQGSVEPGQQQRQGHDLTGVEVADHGLGSADAVDQSQGQSGDQRQRGHERRLQHRDLDADVADLPALAANPSPPGAGSAEGFVSVVPAAENRSVIRVDMSALLFAASNCRAASFPLSRRVGMMNRGSRRIDITVTCQEIVTMTPTVSARDTKFDTIPDRVFENARWAPMTSVLSRETRAPVRVRLKKAIGIDWTWSYTAVR